MRCLFLLRGIPASGKSRWIRENELEPYTLSTDDIRTMFKTPELTVDGTMAISNVYDARVFPFLNLIIEEKMARGELILVDATHYRASFISDYKKLASKYRYRVFVVDFTDVPLEECLRRNQNRAECRRVPEDVIRKMHTAITQNVDTLPTFAKVISRDESLEMIDHITPYDFNKWERVVVFGDIHGCYQPLERYFAEHPFDDKAYYIFAGDYIDRGIQNAETLEFLFTLKDKPNVLFLEGNHERWLRTYAHGDDKSLDGASAKVIKEYLPMFSSYFKLNAIRSKEFKKHTMPQIGHIDKKELSRFCSKLGQMAYFTFGEKTYFVCHGGIPTVPNLKIPTVQLIKGVGEYEDTFRLYDNLRKQPDTVFIHAHRNSLKHNIKVADNIYNVCDEVEWGGYLRVLHIGKDGQVGTFKYKNHIFKELPKEAAPDDKVTIENLRKSPLTHVMNFGEITSINFTRSAFNKKQWNELTCTARGLFIENRTDNVIARSYNKFFNLGERAETQFSTLCTSLSFPVNVYLKENGFLGIVSVYDDDFLFASKSRIDGPFAGYVKDLFYKLFSEEQRGRMFDYMKEHNSTMVFECIHAEDNTHPIIYTEEKMILLDIIKNDLQYSNLPYEELASFATDINVSRKKLVATLNNAEELKAFRDTKDCTTKCNPYEAIEGYVFVDDKNFMFKWKTTFYQFWKWQRGLLEKIQKGRSVPVNFFSEADAKVYALLLKMKKSGELTYKTTIQDIEKKFWNSPK